MSKPVRLLPEARAEFDEAADWYDRQNAGLGQTFIVRIREALSRIAADPERNAKIYLEVRKALVKKVPYVVLYRNDPDEILVISIFHTSRNPSIWKFRS